MLRSQEASQWSFWALLPGLVTLLFTLIYLVPKPTGSISNFMPLLPLMAVFYWGLISARGISYPLVFVVGMIIDTVQNLPLGVSSVSFMVFLAFLGTQRKYIQKEGFVLKWGFFSLALFLTVLLQWLLVSFCRSAAAPILPALMQWLFSVSIYPVFHRLFEVMAHRVTPRRWHSKHGR